MVTFTERMDEIYGTRVYQKIDGANEIGEQILTEATAKMRQLEEILSFYKPTSEVSLINANAGKKFTTVSKDTFEIIKAAKEYAMLTDGCFDVTIAPLVKAWGIGTLQPKVLSAPEIEEILPLVNSEEILLDQGSQGVMLKRVNQKIDLGGIAKGYIADEMITFYKAKGIEHAIINIGGNVKVLGGKDEHSPWNIGIYEPKKHSEQVMGVLKLKDASVVTSGSYERTFIYEGKAYHHILNPKTGLPVETDLKSITLVSEVSLQGDALSTPLFMMGKYKACEFMEKYKLSGIMITSEDEMIITRDLIPYFSLGEGAESLRVSTF